jgi:hypothetical protein
MKVRARIRGKKKQSYNVSPNKKYSRLMDGCLSNKK